MFTRRLPCRWCSIFGWHIAPGSLSCPDAGSSHCLFYQFLFGTLPVTIESLEQRAGVSNRTTSFVAPLGATINMDGTALFECVAALFIAQAYGIELGFIQQFLVVLTALLASIGAAGIPMTGLVMLSIVLSSVGLPLEGIGLILAVDRILDMFRTTVNVWSDSCGTALIARYQGEKLDITER